MANRFKIEIDNSEVYRYCNLVTSYMGTKEAADGVQFSSIALQEEDKDIISYYLDLGVMNILTTIEHYIEDIGGDDNKVIINIAMPDNWNSSLKDSMRDAILSYISNIIVVNWLRIVKHDYEEKYIAQANEYLFRLKKIIYARKRPEKPLTVFKEQEEDI